MSASPFIHRTFPDSKDEMSLEWEELVFAVLLRFSSPPCSPNCVTEAGEAGEGLCAGDTECGRKSGMFAVLTMASILLLATVPRNLYCRMKFIAGDSDHFYFSVAMLIKQIKFTKCEAITSVHYYKEFAR